MTHRSSPETEQAINDLIAKLMEERDDALAKGAALFYMIPEEAAAEIKLGDVQEKWKQLLSRHAHCAPTDPLTDLVERFSKALLAKLRLAEANGRSGWDRDDWEKQCQEGLLRHVDKGDPRDVAAYCAFMWHHGWITALQGGRLALSVRSQTAEHCHKLIGQLFEKPATKIRLSTEDVDLIKRALTDHAALTSQNNHSTENTGE